MRNQRNNAVPILRFEILLEPRCGKRKHKQVRNFASRHLLDEESVRPCCKRRYGNHGGMFSCKAIKRYTDTRGDRLWVTYGAMTAESDNRPFWQHQASIAAPI